MQRKIYYKKLFKTKNNVHFADVIYKNFLNLRKDHNLKHTRNDIIKLLNSDVLFGYLIYNGKILIGYIIGEQMNLNDGRVVLYITYIYVARKYRKKGFGEQLVKIVLQLARDKGISFVLLTCDRTNEKICNFYKKRGFVLDPILGDNKKNNQVYTYYL